MDKNARGIGLVDVAGIIVIAAVVLAIGLPSAGRAREMSKRSVCAVNLKGIGESARIYAQGHNGQWMVPAFREAAINNQGIDYRGSYHDSVRPSNVGYRRLQASDGLSTALSTTRAFWMLVRSGDVSSTQFICPSSEDAPDQTENPDSYYDFGSWRHVSYGYQVPFGPADTRARENAHPSQVFAADKGPFFAFFTPSWLGATLDAPPSKWKLYNSHNHHNGSDLSWAGEGQNCLFVDASVRFARTPVAGVANDNIYTTSTPRLPNGQVHGETPEQVTPPPYPGQDAFGWGNYSTTDSLIYPYVLP